MLPLIKMIFSFANFFSLILRYFSNEITLYFLFILVFEIKQEMTNEKIE